MKDQELTEIRKKIFEIKKETSEIKDEIFYLKERGKKVSKKAFFYSILLIFYISALILGIYI